MDYQTIYLVRHAESTMKGRYCGSRNASLSRRGMKQAKKVGEFFHSLPIDVCSYSDMKRTQQTSSYLRREGIVFIKSPQIREIDFGDWEGCKFSTVTSRWPKIYKQWIRSPTRVDIPSGERFTDFCRRIKSFSKKLCKSKAKNIVVVAHGGSLAVLIMILLKKPTAQFWKWVVPLASISIFKRSFRGKLMKFKRVRLIPTK